MAWHMIVAAAAALAIRYRSEAPASFVAANPHALEMTPAPVDPAWILSGNPQARVSAHSKSPDECAATGIWDCTAGTFRWHFGWDETVVILEGEVNVTPEGGVPRLLQAGDIAYFKGGTWATWQIDNYVRKIAFLRRPFPAPLALLYKLRSALRRSPGALIG